MAIEAEQAAFSGFTNEFASFWRGVTSEYAVARNPKTAPSQSSYHSVNFEN